jgi:2-dehydro-3-deoxyglucarate aldolase
LSGSLGQPGNFEFGDYVEALDIYEEISKKYKKPMGIHIVEPNSQLAIKYINRGYQVIAVGIDTLYLGSACRRIINELEK